MRARATFTRLAASALVLAMPAAADAGTACGGNTFTTCASGTIDKILGRNGKVRLRMEKSDPTLTRAPDEAAFVRSGVWRLSEEAQAIAAKPLEEKRAIPNEALHPRSATTAMAAKRVLAEGKTGKRGVADVNEALEIPNAHARFASAPPFEFVLLPGRHNDPSNGNDDVPDEVANDCPEGAKGQGNERALCDVILTPEPSSLVLLVTALAGLTALGWQRRPKA